MHISNCSRACKLPWVYLDRLFWYNLVNRRLLRNACYQVLGEVFEHVCSTFKYAGLHRSSWHIVFSLYLVSSLCCKQINKPTVCNVGVEMHAQKRSPYYFDWKRNTNITTTTFSRRTDKQMKEGSCSVIAHTCMLTRILVDIHFHSLVNSLV